MKSVAEISQTIGRSHLYWGRKPLGGLLNILESKEVKIKEDDIVLDPFCGGGNAAIASLIKGARVIASDLNPMGVFLTKVLVRPIGIPTLIREFENVKHMVSQKI